MVRSDRPAPGFPRRDNSVASSSIVDQTSSSAIPGPSKPAKASRSSDPIVLTTTTPSSRTSSGPTSAATKAAGFELVIGLTKSTKRTGSSSSSDAKGKARADPQLPTSTTDDSSTSAARASLKDRSKTIAHDSPEPEGAERALGAPPTSPDVLLLDPTTLPHLHGQPNKKRKPSVGNHFDDGSSEILATSVEEAAAALPRTESKQSSRANSRTAAVSEDEDGRTAAQREAQRVNERLEEEDDDYGASGKRKKAKKPKAQPKKRAAAAVAPPAPASIGSGNGDTSRRQDSVEAEQVKAKQPRRIPTLPKDGVPASSKAATQATSPEQPTSARPKRQRKERTSSAYVYESPLKSNAKTAVPVLAVPETQEQEPEQAAAAPVTKAATLPEKVAKQAGKRKGAAIVHDSEEDDEVDSVKAAGPRGPPPEDADALKADTPQPQAEPPAKTKEAARRTKANQRKRIVASSDAEDEGGASDATSAIQTGDEFSDDEDEPVGGRKKGKGKASARGKGASGDPVPVAKRPRLSTSPNRSHGRSASTESRIEQMMKAAATDTEDSLLMAASKTGATSRKNNRLAIEDDEEEKEADPTPGSSNEETKVCHSSGLFCLS